ncbi:MAG: energy-coupling factor transporter transmembrane protein EcfT [Oscillospiraceae bacterium]|jgi:energy-coupling factor transport system permease protein|nr:energy-coupling factor transporter transmembrane protein EcfT [Oscillospiraceae bacterium]
MKNDAFSRFHPLVNMLYFALTIGFSFVYMHPICLGISFVCGFAYMILLDGAKAMRFAATFLLPIFFIAAAVNPMFSHAGATILAYLPNGNPITLESILYGIAAACMLVTVIAWFRCYTAVMTSDKFVYLFGRIIPALSLVLSMALRFIPHFTLQMRAVADAQRGVGRDISQGNLIRRAKHGVRILSITVTWALENAIETADSMRSRGYGLPGRNAFSLFKLERRDRAALLFLCLCGAYIITGAVLGGLAYLYFPRAAGARSVFSMSLFLVYLLFLSLPLILHGKEVVQWKRSYRSETSVLPTPIRKI